MGFSQKVKEEALIACGRHCCICHKFCGTKIEVHHIKLESEEGTNTLDNAIPLCFDCHSDMTSYHFKHPKGTKYTESELRKHRDSWFKKIKINIGTAPPKEIVETDKDVYNILVKILPWNGSIQFIREISFSAFSFSQDDLNELNEFIYRCKNPAFEFIDPDLEGLRINLLNEIKHFINSVGLKTYPTAIPGKYRIPKDWEIDIPDKYYEGVKILDTAADKVCETYDTLIKTATRKLSFIPETLSSYQPVYNNIGKNNDDYFCPNCSDSKNKFLMSPIPKEFIGFEGANYECTKCGYKKMFN